MADQLDELLAGIPHERTAEGIVIGGRWARTLAASFGYSAWIRTVPNHFAAIWSKDNPNRRYGLLPTMCDVPVIVTPSATETRPRVPDAK